MRRMLLPALLSLSFAFPPSASAADVPQWTNSFGMTFSLIPAGKSVIGREGWAGVSPRREITISTEFGMATTEVTQAQWKAVMGGKNPSEPFLGDDLPVNRVSWNDAQAFIDKLNELDAPRRYRLPTNAEWEHAYRAGSQATWVTGDGTPAFSDSLREYEWFAPDKRTHPVAQKKPNGWGLYDMGGNVREWVQDWWQHDYYGGMPGVDPAGPAVGNMRVWRGGSYEDSLEACSFVGRDGDKPGTRSKRIGFRVVLEGDSLRSALGGDSSSSAQGGESAMPIGDLSIPAGVPSAYVPILDNLQDILANGLRGRDREDGEYGVMERWQGSEGPEALASVGWTLLDISGDGQDELLIAPVAEQDGRVVGEQLYAIYTIKDGKPYLVLEGTTRNAFALMDGGPIMHHGAGGAMIQIFGVCGLSKDGTELVWRDYLFTMAKDSPTEIGYFRNDSGVLDKKKSITMTEARFEKTVEALLARRGGAVFSPFSGWRPAAAVAAQESGAIPSVSLRWADDALKGAASYSSFIVPGQGVQVAFCAGKTVKDIKVLKLDFVDIDDSGKVKFDTQELFSQDVLEPRRPLVLSLPMLGTIPQYGVSCVDEHGKAHRFAITESGEDGSPQLMPF